MATADLVARLEAVTQRLERVAGKMGGKGGGGGGDDEAPEFVGAFRNLVATEGKAFADAVTALAIPDMAELSNKAFNNIADLVEASAYCKRPSPQDLMAFLKPGVDAINAADTLKMKGKKQFASHYTAFYEAMVGISWVTMQPPTQLPLQHAEGQRQATDFNLNKILKTSKTANDKEKQQAFVKALQALNTAQVDFIKEHFKTTGLTWNPKGKDLNAYKPGSGGGGASAPAAGAAATSKPAGGAGKGGGGDVGAVFAELSKGLNVTKGLKKVDDSMKTKNRKPDEKSGKVTMKAQAKKKRSKGAPSTANKGGRWMIENYDEGLQTFDKGDIKSNVYITMCDDTTVQITTKVKAVTIDSCIGCRIYVKEIVSTVEMVNCKKCTIYCELKVPSISVDKSESARVVLMKDAYACNPGIYTSNISAMNVEIPGKTPEDDTVEIPIPEQFLTKIDSKTGTATTEQVTHG